MPRLVRLVPPGALLIAVVLLSCSRSRPGETPGAESGGPQQAIVENAAQSITRMRSAGEHESIDYFLRNAKAVAIFPRVIKASFIFGGEGGNGVMVARGPDGSWSSPAFYSIGAGSVGLQLGYQEATIVLFLMNEATLYSAIGSNVTLGADASVATGTIGPAGHAASTTTGKDIYQFVEVGGVFAGASLDGTVIGPRPKHNEAYYGPGATPHGILIERKHDRAETEVLKRALATDAESSAPSEPPSEDGETAAETGTQGLTACSDPRPADVCAQVYEPVCAARDTGVRCVRAPCPESREWLTFSNACFACQDPKTHGFKKGPCAGRVDR